MTTTNDTPRIYVACLACYNEGRLIGLWHDATDLPEPADHPGLGIAYWEALTGCGRYPHHEEFAIHDHENFEGLSVGEYTPLDDVAELARLIEEHGPAYAAFVNHTGGDGSEFEESYRGEYESLEDFAVEFLDETGQLDAIPENLRYYFDYEKFANDLVRGGDISTAEAPNYHTYVFWSV